MNKFVIADWEKCIGCNTCMAGCVDVHERAGLTAFPRLHVTYLEDATMPLQCRNCDDAPCEKVCPVHAITFDHRAVQLNESVCIGCKLCALVCPFGAITPHGTMPMGEEIVAYGHVAHAGSAMPAGEESPIYDRYAPQAVPPPERDVLHPLLQWTKGQRTIAVKCDLCYFRPQGPECVRVCPTHTLRLVDEANVDESIRRRRAQTAFDHPA
jgi:hydrogenase-4 component A